GHYAYFTWIAAHSSGSSSGVRNFDLYINDQYVLTFTTYSKQYSPYECFTAKDNTAFMFDLKTKDATNNSRSMTYLQVPVSKYKPSNSLKIKMVGQNLIGLKAMVTL